MSLDKRLKDAIKPLASGWESWAHDQLDGTSYIQGELENIEQIKKNTVEAIKQAFIAEGWANKHDTIVKTYKAVRLKNTPLSTVIDEELFMKLPDYMTGPEWLARFEKEYHNKADWIASDESMGPDAEHDVLLAARLAAGVYDD